jgi:hypothetical protein
VTSERPNPAPTPEAVETVSSLDAADDAHAAALTCGLGNLSEAWDRMRYEYGKTQGELEELREKVHQFAYLRKGSPGYLTARAYLVAIARERQMLLEECARREEGT